MEARAPFVIIGAFVLAAIVAARTDGIDRAAASAP